MGSGDRGLRALVVFTEEGRVLRSRCDGFEAKITAWEKAEEEDAYSNEEYPEPRDRTTVEACTPVFVNAPPVEAMRKVRSCVEFKEEVDVRYIPEARLGESEERPPRVVGGGPRLGAPRPREKS